MPSYFIVLLLELLIVTEVLPLRKTFNETSYLLLPSLAFTENLMVIFCFLSLNFTEYYSTGPLNSIPPDPEPYPAPEYAVPKKGKNPSEISFSIFKEVGFDIKLILLPD